LAVAASRRFRFAIGRDFKALDAAHSLREKYRIAGTKNGYAPTDSSQRTAGDQLV
jgi:hypothetical protein